MALITDPAHPLAVRLLELEADAHALGWQPGNAAEPYMHNLYQGDDGVVEARRQLFPQGLMKRAGGIEALLHVYGEMLVRHKDIFLTDIEFMPAENMIGVAVTFEAWGVLFPIGQEPQLGPDGRVTTSPARFEHRTTLACMFDGSTCWVWRRRKAGYGEAEVMGEEYSLGSLQKQLRTVSKRMKWLKAQCDEFLAGKPQS